MSTMIDTGITETDILAFLVEDYKKQARQPGEFTVKEFAERVGDDEEKVRDYLDKQVKVGVLYKRSVAGGRNIYGKSR